jgi:dienelactone hydrolase
MEDVLMLKTVATAAAVALAAPALAGETVRYTVDGEAFEGYFAAAENPQGLVFIVQDWDGLTDYEKRRADMLAEMGYDAFAVDMFGEGIRPAEVDHRRALTGALYGDRAKMRALLAGGLEQARALSEADRIVAMGYCFGGAVTLELARSGMAEDVVGYASFHGGLSTPEGQSWPSDSAPVLILHGGADAAIPMSEVATFAEELEAANVAYEIEVYSGAPHAFTVFGSDRYRETADRKSWDAFSEFLTETLGG